jgi:hypothetical protein
MDDYMDEFQEKERKNAKKFLKRKLRYELPLIGKVLFWRNYNRAKDMVSGWYGDDPWTVLAAMDCGKEPSWLKSWDDLEKDPASGIPRAAETPSWYKETD